MTGARQRGVTPARVALLIVAWLLSIVVLALASVATLFLTPLGMLAWSVVAVPLAVVTTSALRSTPPERRRLAWVVGTPWLALAAVALHDAVSMSFDWPSILLLAGEAAVPWILLTYAVFPLFVSLVATHVLWKQARAWRRAAAAASGSPPAPPSAA